ncbi:unnamed protein product [Schistosoma spindalis]|nr:unnamed protein product [Schistosoma spindale]
MKMQHKKTRVTHPPDHYQHAHVTSKSITSPLTFRNKCLRRRNCLNLIVRFRSNTNLTRLVQCQRLILINLHWSLQHQNTILKRTDKQTHRTRWNETSNYSKMIGNANNYKYNTHKTTSNHSRQLDNLHRSCDISVDYHQYSSAAAPYDRTPDYTSHHRSSSPSSRVPSHGSHSTSH